MPLMRNPITPFSATVLALLCAAGLQAQALAETPAYHPSQADLDALVKSADRESAAGATAALVQGAHRVGGENLSGAGPARRHDLSESAEPQALVVLNSGNTFHGPEGYTQSSWFLYRRLGDYAVVHDDTGEADIFGYFDRNWKAGN